MKRSLVIVLVICCISALLANPVPGDKRVKHRIYVPTKIHTVYVTKIIKVPEHHHHHHTVKKEHHHHHGHHHEFDDNFDHEI